GYYFDGVTLNILIQPEPINGFNSTTYAAGDIPAAARQLLDEAGLSDKHIWITELNAVPTLDPVGGMSEATVQISLEQQVDFIVQGTSLGLAAGAERIAIYKLFDSNFNPATTPPYGLVRSDNSRRPAFDAYAHVVALFADSLTATAGRSTNARLIVLRQPSQTIFVMWSAGTESVDFWIEASFEDTVQLTDAAGNPLPEPRYGVGPSETTVHVIATPIAEVDRSGNVLIGGSPRILILDTTAPRRVWASLGDATGVRIH
ncbi:MAG: hypothetical protein GYB66_13920, partial [Chloroflexi bacterium]|nr:hypothetical protein [Chloroflexota bacterium]